MAMILCALYRVQILETSFARKATWSPLTDYAYEDSNLLDLRLPTVA